MYGYGYNPLSVGDCLDDDKFEVMRKLGWADVWLGFSSQSLFTPSANIPSKNRLYSANAVSLIKRRYVEAKLLTVNATCGVTY